MYTLLGISLTLAFLLIVNMAVAIFASALWRVVSKHVLGLSVGTQAQLIFGLRILPVAAALVFVFGFVVPSYLLHEPLESGEIVSNKLGLIAAASSIGVLIALYRVLSTWWVTRSLTANWLRSAEPLQLADVSVPTFKISHQFPVIAVVGIFRPKLFVAEQALASLDQNEFSAAIAHEFGHLRANDNFKRTVLRVCRDLLIVPFGKELDHAWAENAESLADEFAATRGGSTALDLASALVKIARIVPANTCPAMPAAAFMIGETQTDITTRVRRLVRLSETKLIAEQHRFLGFSPFGLFSAAALAALIVLPLIDQQCLTSTHEVVEQFVSLLR